MKRYRLGVAATVAIVTALSCTDARNSVLPTAPTSPGLTLALTAPSCLNLEQVKELAEEVFGERGPNYRAVTSKIDQIVRELNRHNPVGAKTKAFDAVRFILLKAGKPGLRGNPSDLDALIKAVFCLAGITAPQSSSAFLVYPSDAPQVLIAGDGLAGVSLPGSPVSEPTLITVTPIVTVFPPGSGPLNTKLDQYPGFYEFKKQSATDPPLLQPVVVAVCPSAVPADVRARLRLGHQAVAGFEVTPPADASFLSCPASNAMNYTAPSWLRTLASLVLPQELHATAVRIGTGGVGGSAGEFSPFAPVDPLLSFTGGVGGSAGEFLLLPVPLAAPAASSSTAPRGPVRSVPSPLMRALQAAAVLPATAFLTAPAVSCATAAIGAAIDPACRPLVTLTTHLGTPFASVPIGWGVTAGGGVIAPELPASATCGTFGATASNVTGALGKAGVCWTTGPAAGVNTVVATPNIGGDAPSGVSFSPPTLTFSVTTSLVTPIATATGGSFTYDGTGHPGSGTCSDGLTPVLTYDGSGAVPLGVGAYTLTVTCGAGNPLFTTVSTTAAITITPRPATATAGSGTLTYGTSVSALPCVVSGLLSADAGSVTCTTGAAAITSVGTYATFPVVSPAAPVNYAVGAVNGSVTVTPYVQSNCFAAPVTAISPVPSTTVPGPGTALPVAVTCTLLTGAGAPVSGASGDLLVEDMGLFGLIVPVSSFTVTGAFAPSGGSYTYLLDPPPPVPARARYYRLTATWNDGSHTVGWILAR